MSGNVSRPGASVTGRALALVGAFDEDHRRLTLTELAARADLPLPTAHRLVAELVAWGALARTSSGQYVVGRRLWDIGLLRRLPHPRRHPRAVDGRPTERPVRSTKSRWCRSSGHCR